jgi:LacI family gluconate utilization system Gnt-I transcriptional repressor
VTLLRPAPRPFDRRRRGTGRTTIEEVAERAEVSTSTVSRVLRRSNPVTEELARRVQAAVDELGYQPNPMARGLAAARGRTVGVIVPSMINSFFAATLEALSLDLQSKGYQTLIGHSAYDPMREEKLIEAFLTWSPAAVVVTGLGHTPRASRALRTLDVPVVEMWETDGPPIGLAVGFSHRDVGRRMTRHLLDRGHRRLAFIGAMMHLDRRAAARCAGFKEELAAAGLAPIDVVALPGRADVGSGSAALDHLLSAHSEIDAVYCSNDVVALGALFAAQRQGLTVPGRLAIAGFGDLDFAACAVPPLTTARPPRHEIGARVAQMLLTTFEGGSPPQPILDLGCELVPRASA